MFFRPKKKKELSKFTDSKSIPEEVSKEVLEDEGKGQQMKFGYTKNYKKCQEMVTMVNRDNFFCF